VLTINAGVSAYTSASSSNVSPFDGQQEADPFFASTGASSADTWVNMTGTYSHSSKDRNEIVVATAGISKEFDYTSFSFGGSYTKLFNHKNTELSITATAYLDKWDAIYPIELRPFGIGGIGFFRPTEIRGSSNYKPYFKELENTNRNSYMVGFGFSQILHKKIQGALALDLVQQEGLLSTPFQRVYFADIADSFIENFQLADAIERLPDTRFKVALGGRLHGYLNEVLTVHTYYRFYKDSWGINAHAASVEIHIKITNTITLYPSYRWYKQTAADYFNFFETGLSTDTFYTSDYDLSRYTAHQMGFGISYTDILTKAQLWKLGFKSIDLKYYNYSRDTSFSLNIVTAGITFSVQ